MMDLQKMLDALSAQMELERSKSQMTIGGAIMALQDIPSDTSISPTLNPPHSYRGYYSDLSFPVGGKISTAGDLLAELKTSMGKTFCGYKGGDFKMGISTPLWSADYGCCGQKIVGFSEIDGELVIEMEDDE